MLNERANKILAFIRSFTRDNGYPPTIREIGESFGISSTNGVRYYLNEEFTYTPALQSLLLNAPARAKDIYERARGAAALKFERAEIALADQCAGNEVGLALLRCDVVHAGSQWRAGEVVQRIAARALEADEFSMVAVAA